MILIMGFESGIVLETIQWKSGLGFASPYQCRRDSRGSSDLFSLLVILWILLNSRVRNLQTLPSLISKWALGRVNVCRFEFDVICNPQRVAYQRQNGFFRIQFSLPWIWISLLGEREISLQYLKISKDFLWSYIIISAFSSLEGYPGHKMNKHI